MALSEESEVMNTFLSSPIDDRGAVSTFARHGRHQHISPVALVTKNPSHVKIRSDKLTYSILLGLLDGKHYTHYPARRLAEYRQTLPKSKGFISIALTPHSQESWEHVVALLHVLGDELVDTFLALLAVALDTNGNEDITSPFAITVDDILSICQKKKSKGGYASRQQQNVIAHLDVLTHALVYASLVLQNGKQWLVESPLLEVQMNEQQEANESAQKYERWHLKLGNWATMIPEHLHQTAMMARQVLRYHAKDQKHEKRLGRYLTMLYRVNAHRHGGCVKVSMGVLLEHAGIPLDHDNPGRTRDAIESALNQLRSDDIIGPFAPLEAHSWQDREAQERIEQHAYHWWDDYQRQLWVFEAPQHFRVIYKSTRREDSSPD